MKKSFKKRFALVLALVLVLSCTLPGCGGGDSADNPAKLSSAGAFSRWFGQQKKSLTNVETPGTYYFKLSDDVELATPAVIDNGHTVIIDLDGYTISNKKDAITQAFLVSEGAALVLKNGSIAMPGADANGGLLQLSGAASSLELVDMTLTNTDDSAVTGRVSGGVLHAESPAEGQPAVVSIRGNTVLTGSQEGQRRAGGTVSLGGNAVLYLYDGTVQNGKAGVAGNLYAADQAVIQMFGGSIQGGEAVRGNETTGFGGGVGLSGKAQMHMFGGTITGNTAGRDGGNVFLSNYGSADAGLYLYGGEIVAGTANNGGNVFAQDTESTVRMYGGNVTEGVAAMGGNLAASGGNLVLRGGTLTGLRGKESNMYGSNIFAEHGTVSIYDGMLITDGMVSGSGGNIYLTDSQMDIYGGTITKGETMITSVSEGGGNIFISGESVFRLYNGEISRGISNCDNKEEESAAAGNVGVKGHSMMHMFGGTICDAMVYGNITRGGGVYVYGQQAGNHAVFHMYGGAIRNGELNNTMRGMLIGAYSESNGDTGHGIARLFAGDLEFTGSAQSQERGNSIYSNSYEVFVFDEKAYEGLTRRVSRGACPDATHNNQVQTCEATCLIPGYTEFNCDTCGQWYQITAEATGHTETTETVAATPTSAGFTKHSCSACDYVTYTDVVLPE